MTDARASSPCQVCSVELIVGIVHAHCECGALLYDGDVATYEAELADKSYKTMIENHPKPLCKGLSELK